jgi:hypothetical protein
VYEPPPPPLKPPEAEGGRPMLSFRVELLHLIFDSRLGLELESQVWKFISVQVTPVFVTGESSPFLKDSFGHAVTQHSSGLGPLAGGSLGVGFWINGKPMKGTALQAVLTNYSYRHESRDEIGKIDEVTHVDRQLFAFVDSRQVMGIFTIAAGFGLGVELNQERRCFTRNSLASATTNCAHDELLLALNRNVTLVTDMHPSTYPILLNFRLSLGVTF